MTHTVTFEPNARYVFHGVGYHVLQMLDDGTQVVRNLETNTLVTHRLSDLWQAWQDNTLEFAREGPNVHHNDETSLKTASTIADVAALPTHVQDITWHRYHLLHPLIHLSSRQRTKQVVEARIDTYLSSLEAEKRPGREAFLLSLAQARNASTPQEASAEVASEPSHHDISPPGETSGTPSPSSPHLSARTVARWLRRYQESQGDIRSLVPSYHQRGPHHHFLTPVIETLLQQAIKQTYLTAVRAPITHVITCFEALLLAENAQRAPEARLGAPGKMTIYRYIHQLDRKTVEWARNGPRKAERDHHQSWQGPRPTRPNQRAEFDFTQLDILVVDAEDRLPIGRPTIAALRDKATGYLNGIFISFEPPSYRLVMDCMLYAFLPKTHVKDLFQTHNEYLAFGIPEVLVVDNAIELHRDLELACLQLGIELQHMPVRTPWFKGSIERWFRTLNTDMIHATPGTTFSNFLERGEYQSHKHACITLDRLWELLHLWIVDVYTQEIHHGIGPHPLGYGIPARLWQQALEEQFVPRLPPSRKDLLVLISRNTTRTLQHYGIDFEHLRYQDPHLAPLRSQLAHAKTYRLPPTVNDQLTHILESNRLPIKYHPGDLSRIWVLDPFSNRYLEVPAVDQQYTENLSLWKHRVIKRYAQEELTSTVDHQALILAKTRIQQIITQEMRLTQKIHARQTMARWLNSQVITWMTDTPATDPASAGERLSPAERPEKNASSVHQSPSDVHPSLTQDLLTPRKEASVADLSTSLPPIDQQVVLLSDPAGHEQTTPFVPFPPLSTATRAPQEHTPAPSHPTPSAGKTRPKKQARAPQQHNRHASSADADQMIHTTEPSSAQPPSPLAQRQQSFGIAASLGRGE